MTKEHHEHHEHHEEIKKSEEKKKNPWMYSTIAMTILLALVVVFSFSTENTGTVANQIPAQEAADKSIAYINTNLLEGYTATLVSVEEEQDLYKIELQVSDQNYDSYVTKDGRLLFVSGIEMNEETETTTTVLEETPQTEKPVANAFVMSYCPYGLQFLKAYIPVIELLGDKADLNVNFVSYIMHGKKEIDENTVMYCIQKEQKDKFAAYLRCFVTSGESATCVTQAGINNATLSSCIAATDAQFNITGLYNDKSTWSGGSYPMYPVEDILNAQYSVRGSPTFVVNGKTLSVSRSAEAVKQAICAAFITPPAECSQQLSTSQESAGIGAIGSGSGSDSSGTC